MESEYKEDEQSHQNKNDISELLTLEEYIHMFLESSGDRLSFENINKILNKGFKHKFSTEIDLYIDWLLENTWFETELEKWEYLRFLIESVEITEEMEDYVVIFIQKNTKCYFLKDILKKMNKKINVCYFLELINFTDLLDKVVLEESNLFFHLTFFKFFFKKINNINFIDLYIQRFNSQIPITDILTLLTSCSCNNFNNEEIFRIILNYLQNIDPNDFINIYDQMKQFILINSNVSSIEKYMASITNYILYIEPKEIINQNVKYIQNICEIIQFTFENSINSYEYKITFIRYLVQCLNGNSFQNIESIFKCILEIIIQNFSNLISVSEDFNFIFHFLSQFYRIHDDPVHFNLLLVIIKKIQIHITDQIYQILISFEFFQIVSNILEDHLEDEYDEISDICKQIQITFE